MGHYRATPALDRWRDLEDRVAEDVDKDTQPGRKWDSRLTAPLLAVAVVALLALGWLAAQRIQLPSLSAPAPTATPTPEPAASATPLAVQATPTATHVVVEASPSPTPVPTEPVVQVLEPVYTERIRNGSFENGFKDHSLGLGWNAFSNGSAIFEFMDETWPPAVFDGEHAQRIQVREASQPDRYAGIYQTVTVIPGESYELVLHGQIRTGSGDIRVSQYGYRMQLGFDYQGGQNWQTVDKWIELPWDEQSFDSDLLFFYDYIMSVVPTGPRLTIFIRTWNKWADPGRVEYTLDDLSLMGPAPPEEIALDKPLPATGDGPLSSNGWLRLLASIVIVALLLAGALWQARRRRI
jgi:hypothetical protein